MDAEGEREFRDFVRARSAALLGTAYALTGEQGAAEDLLQGALARTAARWGSVHTAPEAYVRRAMYHAQVSWWRRRGRIREDASATLPDRAAPDDHAGAVADRLAVRDALRRLGPRQRAVLVLRFLEDRSVAETAEILGCSPGTVASQTNRALATLRRLAGDLDADRLLEVNP